MKKIIKLIIGITLLSSTFFTSANEWMTESDITGLRPATKEEKIWLENNVKGMTLYDFHEKNILIHHGDLTIPTNFASGYPLVIRGNLTIKGLYDDYRTTYGGHLIVMGNMQAENIHS